MNPSSVITEEEVEPLVSQQRQTTTYILKQSEHSARSLLAKKIIMILTGIVVLVGLLAFGIFLQIYNSLPLCQGITENECAILIQNKYPLIDGHNDLPFKYREFLNDTVMTTEIPDSWHTNISKILAGTIRGQFWSVFVGCDKQGKDAVRGALEQIDLIRKFNFKYRDNFVLSPNSLELQDIFSARDWKIASMIGVDGGHMVDGSLGVLRMLFDLGAKYLALTQKCNNEIADSASNGCANDGYCRNGACVGGVCNAPQNQGLTQFGESAIHEMNRMGMLIDLSHSSHIAMRKAINTSKSPVIFSHSNAYSLCNNVENVPDDVLYLLRENGGVIMVSFDVDLLSCGNDASVKHVGDHIDYIVSGKCPGWKPNCNPSNFTGIGVAHVGIGSGFDGISKTPTGLEDVSKFPHLTAELVGRGYDIVEIGMIIGDNIIRVMSEAEQFSEENEEKIDEAWLNPSSTCRTGT